MASFENLVLIQTILTRYILVLCSLLGLLGSLFNLLVFCQKRFRSNACSIYFRATSIFNILVILLGITPVLLTSFLPNEPFFTTSLFCKTRAYITHVFLMMSRSSVALACIDRFALCSPSAHIRRLNQPRLAIILLANVVCLWLIIPIHIIIYTDIQLPERRCGASGIYSIIYSSYAATVTVIPLIIMLLFSCWTIKNLRNTRGRIHSHEIIIDTFGNLPGRLRGRDFQLRSMLMGEVIVYLLSTVWFPIYSIYVAITSNTLKSTNRLMIEGFVRYLVLSFLIFLNSCSLFYVHLLTSKVFRRECQQLIRRWYQSNRTTPSTTFEEKNIRRQLNNIYQRPFKDIIPKNNLRMNPLFH